MTLLICNFIRKYIQNSAYLLYDILITKKFINSNIKLNVVFNNKENNKNLEICKFELEEELNRIRISRGSYTTAEAKVSQNDYIKELDKFDYNRLRNKISFCYFNVKNDNINGFWDSLLNNN